MRRFYFQLGREREISFILRLPCYVMCRRELEKGTKSRVSLIRQQGHVHCYRRSTLITQPDLEPKDIDE